MAYDAVSNRTLLSDSTGRYTTVFDVLNRPHTVTNPANLTISYSYDPAGRRAKMVEPFGGVFTYGYSPTNLNTLVVNPDGDRTTWQFDAASRVYLQRLANGIRVSSLYDTADRLVSLANLTSGGTTITSYLDTWDRADNRIARIEQDGTRLTWSYDPTYQLTREQRGGGTGTIAYDTTYVYDPVGNRGLKIDSGAVATFSYDLANQLQKYVDNTGTTTFQFDANGNQQLQQAPPGTTTNTWDFENRLTKVDLPTGIRNTFTYHADGLRVERQDSSGVSNALWDGQRIVEETTPTNTLQAIYTESIGAYGDLISQSVSGVANYFMFEPLGSTARLADAAQNVTDRYVFKAFGEALLSGSGASRYTYVGKFGYEFAQDLSLYYGRARYLDSPCGRWLSVDPVGLIELSNGRAPLIYAYAWNGPTTHIDPSGLLPRWRRRWGSNACDREVVEEIQSALTDVCNMITAPETDCIGPKLRDCLRSICNTNEFVIVCLKDCPRHFGCSGAFPWDTSTRPWTAKDEYMSEYIGHKECAPMPLKSGWRYGIRICLFADGEPRFGSGQPCGSSSKRGNLLHELTHLCGQGHWYHSTEEQGPYPRVPTGAGFGQPEACERACYPMVDEQYSRFRLTPPWCKCECGPQSAPRITPPSAPQPKKPPRAL